MQTLSLVCSLRGLLLTLMHTQLHKHLSNAYVASRGLTVLLLTV